MWDLPRPGLEPVSPALAVRLPTTAPPGKPSISSWVSFGKLHFSRNLSLIHFESFCSKAVYGILLLFKDLFFVALQYSLKSGNVMPPALFFLKIVLTIRGILCFHINFKVMCSCFVKNAIGLHWICRLPWVVCSYHLNFDTWYFIKLFLCLDLLLYWSFKIPDL